VTPGTPTWIWSVVVDGQLYVRGYNGMIEIGTHLTLETKVRRCGSRRARRRTGNG
jgi:hypothetical protein